MEDDFAVPEAPSGTPSKLGNGSSTGKEGSGSGKRKRDSMGDESTCYIMNCDAPRKKGKKLCDLHNQAYDNMSYQARKQTPSKMDSLNQIFSNPATATDAMESFLRDNPASARYKRKTPIQWGQWERQFITRKLHTDRRATDPVEYRQFLKWGVDTMGWTDTETKEEWQKHLRSPLERDNYGLNGCLRLWIPRGEKRMVDTQREESAVYKEGSQQIKNISEQERAALMQHTANQLTGNDSAETSAFLRGDVRQLGGGLGGCDVGSVASGSSGLFDGGPSASEEGSIGTRQSQSAPQETAKEKRARLRLEKLALCFVRMACVSNGGGLISISNRRIWSIVGAMRT